MIPLVVSVCVSLLFGYYPPITFLPIYLSIIYLSTAVHLFILIPETEMKD